MGLPEGWLSRDSIPSREPKRRVISTAYDVTANAIVFRNGVRE
jgi:hypothetical protein